MRRTVTAVLLLYSVSVSAAIFEFSSEFRRDALDAEEETREFFREKVQVHSSSGVSAGEAFSSCTEDGKKSFTWHAESDNAAVPLYIIAGNFYSQEGSGLLYGKLRPYNPDPLAVENWTGLKSGFSPCNSSNPSFALYGAGASFYAGDKQNPFMILSAAHSRCVRYLSTSDSGTSSTGDSASSILSHYIKNKSSDQPVFCSTTLGSITVSPLPFVRSECSYMVFSMSGEGGKTVSWEYDETGGVRVAKRRIEAVSYCMSYNDGLLKSFFETAVCRTEYTLNDVNTYRNGYAYQGEVAFESEAASFYARGKYLGSDYSSPFMSTFGSRSPSNGFFIGLKISPFEKLSAEADGSAEKYLPSSKSSAELAAVVKESICLKGEIWGRTMLETSYRARSDSLSAEPQQNQERINIQHRWKSGLLHVGVAEQTTSHKRAYVVSAGLTASFDEHTLTAEAERIWSKNGCSYLSAAGGNHDYRTVQRNVSIITCGYAYTAESLKGTLTASAESAGTALRGKRISFEIGGTL